MRMPLSKVYRAFPELDRFGDPQSQCASFVAAAQRAEPTTNTLLTIALIPWSIGGFAAIMFVGGLFLSSTVQRFERTGGELSWEAAMLVVLVIGAALGPALSWLMARDVWLRRAIGRRINTCACPACQYSLLGLPVMADAVLCPECGTEHQLAKLGLSPSDILAPPAAGPKR